MNVLKKSLLRVSPDFYYCLRDNFQWFQKYRRKEIDKILLDNSRLTSKADLLAFTDRYIKAYQIPNEIFGLIDALQLLKPTNYVEIGTADGGTHFLIRKLCTSIQTSVAIDVDIRNKYLLDRLTETQHSYYLRGFSDSVKVLNKFAAIFPPRASVDALFIDGDHSYEGVKSDFYLYKDFVRPGGYIIFHDIVADWGQRHGTNTNKYTGGVPKFFKETKDQYEHFTFVNDPEQDGFGIGVLIQP